MPIVHGFWHILIAVAVSTWTDIFVVIMLFVVLQRLFCYPKLMTASVHAIILASLVYL